jgi:hypothetical protein
MMNRFPHPLSLFPSLFALLTSFPGSVLAAGELDPALIGQASGTEATLADDGVVRIGWSRTDVKVAVDGMPLPPAAGLGSWAAFTASEDGTMVMGDTVVFQDEVDAAMDAAFAHGLGVTALHNHFFYDSPKVYFMHIGGAGEPEALASGVGAVWDAIRAVRRAEPQPASGFGGAAPVSGDLDADALAEIAGHPAVVDGGVAKITIARNGRAHGHEIGGSMGLTTWAAFSGSDERAAIDGDFIMSGEEVQPVLRALRAGGVHVVALHNHMIGERPGFYFTHYWGKGPAAELAHTFRGALDAQAAAGEAHGSAR